MIPILFAPRVDPGFYRYAREHGGLFCQTLFQYLYCPNPNNQKAKRARKLTEDIRETFRFGHVKVISEPPANVVSWIQRIPDALKVDAP